VYPVHLQYIFRKIWQNACLCHKFVLFLQQLSNAFVKRASC
jgi:hypothetical protein